MIVFDLKCSAQSHVFEGWFSSSEDYASQKERGLLACPLCGDTGVEKAVMAPAIPAKGNRQAGVRVEADENRDPSPDVPMTTAKDSMKAAEVMKALAAAQAEALKSSEWVGRKFADEARAMHYGEQEHKRIHGEVAPQEARELMEEGVEVAPLIFPVTPPEAQN